MTKWREAVNCGRCGNRLYATMSRERGFCQSCDRTYYRCSGCDKRKDHKGLLWGLCDECRKKLKGGVNGPIL